MARSKENSIFNVIFFLLIQKNRKNPQESNIPTKEFPDFQIQFEPNINNNNNRIQINE